MTADTPDETLPRDPRTHLICLDWGSSNLRAWSLTEDGTVLGAARSADGILPVTADLPADDQSARAHALDEALLRIAGPALEAPSVRGVLACGMVGSSLGWLDAGYLDLPRDLTFTSSDLGPSNLGPSNLGPSNLGPSNLGPSNLATTTISTGHTLWVVPGLRAPGDGQFLHPDVMRGEETQLLGMLGTPPVHNPPVHTPPVHEKPRLIVLPGTHSKWATIDHGRVVDFSTTMTGELFEWVMKHSILGRGTVPRTTLDAAAFRRGLTFAASQGRGGLTAQLFAARTLRLTGDLADHEVGDFLSGILIGDEVRAQSTRVPGAPITLAGSPALVERYRLALTEAGREVAVITDDVTLRGLQTLARLLFPAAPPSTTEGATL